jgi:hypothetical protein
VPRPFWESPPAQSSGLCRGLAGACGFGEANAESLRFGDTFVGDQSDWRGKQPVARLPFS